MEELDNLAELEQNENKIGNLTKNEDGQLIRVVDGQEIIQIEEKTERQVELNRLINLWRMR